jgi:ligand-binding SRPBCC domain-containing protein
MADHVLEARIWLARPRPEVFAFFADPHNLPRLTPPSAGLRLSTERATLAAGAVLDFRMRWLGVPLSWRTYIREYDPPYRFVDVQVRGPWARWEHRHRFLEENGGTWVEDRVTYRLPFGALGRLVHAALVERQLRQAWAYRQARLEEALR